MHRHLIDGLTHITTEKRHLTLLNLVLFTDDNLYNEIKAGQLFNTYQPSYNIYNQSQSIMGMSIVPIPKSYRL